MQHYLLQKYRNTHQKYQKLHERLQRNIRKGIFHQLPSGKKRHLIHRVRKLWEKLKRLEWQLKIGAAGVGVALTLGLHDANAQVGPFVYNEEKNPFPPPYINGDLISYPSLVDIDGDGDMDLFLGQGYEGIKFYKNVGTKISPKFEEQKDENNPLKIKDIGTLAPSGGASFVDIDGDGDFDSFVDTFSRHGEGGIFFYKNIGSKNNPVFEKQSAFENPLGSVESFGDFRYPSFVDIDGDEDYDVFLKKNEDRNVLEFYKNTGDVNAPIFEKQPEQENLIDINGGIEGHPIFTDIDGDGDLDAFIGEFDEGSFIYFYKNIGSPDNPIFELQLPENNPLSQTNYGIDAAFADMDNDGDFDVIIGYVNLSYFINIGNKNEPSFSLVSPGDNNPFSNNVDFKAIDNLVFVDINGDTNQDVFIEKFVKYSENDTFLYIKVNTSGKSEFLKQEDNLLPEGINLRRTILMDIDGDEDNDIYTYNYGIYEFYKNIGSKATPNFELQTEENNPLASLSFFPILVDIDNDGDLDAASVKNDRSIEFYKNEGNKEVAVFVKQSDSDNPFKGIEAYDEVSLSFIDIDGDGDLDALQNYNFDYTLDYGSNTYSFHINYYKNVGTVTGPKFETVPLDQNPLVGFNHGFADKAYFIDVDNDGDYDILLRGYDYEIELHENLGINNPSNNPPTIANAIDDKAVTIDNAFNFTFPENTFSDADGDVLTYGASLSEGGALPDWLTFDATTRTFSGTPDENAVGEIMVKVTASDGKGESVSDEFKITVNPSNAENNIPIVSNAIADQNAREGESFSFGIPENTFTDDDGDELALTASLKDGGDLPAWLLFDAATATFSGTPGNENIGTIELKVTATDPEGASVTDEFVITINPTTTENNAPSLATSIDDRMIPLGGEFNFKVPDGTFSDADGDALTLTASLGDDNALPAWLSFDAATATFSGTPKNDDLGTISVKVTATDPDGESVSDEFIISIEDPTGIEEQLTEGIHLFPNPSEGNFQVVLDMPYQGKVTMNVFNAQGEISSSVDVIKNKELHTYQFQEKLSSGVYFLQIIMKELSTIKRIWIK